MKVALTHATTTRLEKIAVDNGFDLELSRHGDWLGFASTQVPLRLWLTMLSETLFLMAVSQPGVATALKDHGVSFSNPLPDGAVGARGLADMPSLHRAVRRAFQLSNSLPDNLLQVFRTATVAMPMKTEVERIVVQRVGQNIFRDGLMDYWEGRCAVTGLSTRDLLRASHIKPWAACDSDDDRLDVFNGLLLAPHLDAAFDKGFLTVERSGRILIAGDLREEDRRALGVAEPLHIRTLSDAHQPFLEWHRLKVFRANER